MKYLIVCALVLSIAMSTLTCTSNQVYAKFTKKTTSWASEESYEVWSGGVKIQQSPTFQNTQTRVVEYCLSASSNYQYQLYLKDSCGDSWSSGAWLMIEGEYGNRVFKNLLTAAREEVYTLSLYYAIKKTDQWKLTSGSVTGDWNDTFAK